MEDITGKRFGRLTAKEFLRREVKGKIYTYFWKCACDCGKEVVARKSDLVSGNTKSCGCFFREEISKMRTTHGGTKTKLYSVFYDMHRRCEDPKDARYDKYGARGIRVCEEWSDFSNFRDWAYANGYDDSLDARRKCSLDRIDVSKGYSPSNCRWADIYTQANNKTSNVNLTFNGKTQSMKMWSRELGMNYMTLVSRLKTGWTVEDALSTPVRHINCNRRKDVGTDD